MTDTHNGSALATAAKYYNTYGVRAKELKTAGSQVLGYLSALCPVEIITAAGMVPLRLKGDVSEAITRGDAYMETIVCPFVRNVFDAALKGRYSFLDGMVFPHQCDSIDRTYEIWSTTLQFPYWHFLNMPHVADDASIEFTGEILRVFVRSLEEFTGRTITGAAVTEAVKAHNENRRLMRELYGLRKADPPLISGVEMMQVLVAAMSLPVHESSSLVRAVTDEVRRGKPFSGGRKRIMLVGDQVDDAALVGIIENAGASLVVDDLSIGGKMYREDADLTADPLEGIALRYVRKLKLPTTYVGENIPYRESLKVRFGHLTQYIEDFRVDGVILFVYKYCDPYGFEVPALKDFIEKKGVPVLYLEDEYSASGFARVKTRIEAFLEMIAS